MTNYWHILCSYRSSKEWTGAAFLAPSWEIVPVMHRKDRSKKAKFSFAFPFLAMVRFGKDLLSAAKMTFTKTNVQMLQKICMFKLRRHYTYTASPKQSFSIFHYLCSGISVFVQRRNLGTTGPEQPSPPLHPPKVGGLLSYFYKYKSLYSRNMSVHWFFLEHNYSFNGWRGGEGCTVSFASIFGSWAKIFLWAIGGPLNSDL